MHVFRPTLSNRNVAVLFQVLCVGLNIMNLKLFDAYRLINSQILVVTLDYLGDIRVLMCIIWCYFSMKVGAVCDTYKNSSIY